MKRRLLLTLTALLLALSSYAFSAKIGRIHYWLDSRTKTASVTNTGSYYNNTYSGSITIPASVTYRGRKYSVTSIDNRAFIGCPGLTSITIPSSVTSIGYVAFASCPGLTSIAIPSSVTSIDDEAFADCAGLTSIKVAAGNKKYDSRDNCNAIIETASNTLVAGCKTTTIPSSVTSIGSSAFSGCTGLTSITIPSSVKSIGSCAFSDCTGLTSITACKMDPSEYNCHEIAFDDLSYSSVTLYVPAGSARAYKALEPWRNFRNIVETDIETVDESRKLRTQDQLSSNRAAFSNRTYVGDAGDTDIYSESGVATMAQFPGGEGALIAFMNKTVKYPQIAIEHDLQGTVYLRFVVEKDGRVGDVRVTKSLSRECDAAAIAALKKAPRFSPARNANGEPVRVWFNLPVNFQIG